MRVGRWSSQLRFRVLASFAFILWGTILYTHYTIYRLLDEDLPQVELQALMVRGTTLANEFERGYASQGWSAVDELEQWSLSAVHVYDIHGHRLGGMRTMPHQPQIVARVLAQQPVAPTIVTDQGHNYGYYAVPLRYNGTLIGVLEVAEELPPLDRFRSVVQNRLAFAGLVALCSIIAVGMFLGGYLNQALRGIKEQTEAIVNGDFERRLPVRANDEIGQINGYLNRMAEDLERLAKTRNEFLSKVSHELRTPLTIAKGFVSTLQRKPHLATQERTLGIINQQIDDLSRLVNDLLNLSHRRYSEVELCLDEIDLRALVADVLEQHRPALLSRNISLQATCHLQSAYINGDRQRLQQVLGNLIGNASRYCRGQIVLDLNTDGKLLQLRVHDNGIGIAPVDQARIFEPFFQSRHGPRGGAGLGLTVARELVLAHNGTLDVESGADHGTTFTICLPAVTSRTAPSSRVWQRFHLPRHT